MSMTANWGTVLLWVGRVFTALTALALAPSAVMKMAPVPGHHELVQNWNKFGWPENLLAPIGVLEIVCTILYLVPQTAVLGGVFVTGYLAAAFATHLRVGEIGESIVPLVIAVIAWGGLYLRDERVRALLPLRKPAP